MYSTDASKLLEENRKLKKENDLGYQFNSALIMVIIIGLIVSFCCINGLKKELNKTKSKLNMYEIMYNEVVNTREYKAVVACRQEDFWKIECLDFELNERK